MPKENSSIRGAVLTIIKIAISVLLVIYILRAINLPDLGERLRSVRLSALFFLLVLYFLFVQLGGLRAALILRSTVAPGIPLSVVLRRYWVANALGAFTPAQAGELSLGLLLRHYGVDAPLGAAAVILDKILMLALFMICSVVAAFLYLPSSSPLILGILALSGFGATSLLLIRPVRKTFRHRIVEPYFPSLQPIGHLAIDFLLFRRRAMAWHTLLGLVRIIVSGLTIYVGLWAVGTVDVGLLDTCLLNSLIRITTFLPISINGIGVMEGAAMELFSMEGIDVASAAILSAVLLNRAIFYLFSGTILLWRFNTLNR